MKTATMILDDYNASEKEKKYTSMMRTQEDIITRAIRDGDVHGNRLFIFSDREYFHGVQRHWFDEFYERAKREVEDAGYKVSGICICW